ncbi:hypothetical protein NTGBS_180088 [Candidatus Nitrotoga sp. BS]|nr:hypothetical protein NTGBS_180088 [Candidatus Nitrotoga sp. BS]
MGYFTPNDHSTLRCTASGSYFLLRHPIRDGSIVVGLNHVNGMAVVHTTRIVINFYDAIIIKYCSGLGTHVKQFRTGP